MRLRCDQNDNTNGKVPLWVHPLLFKLQKGKVFPTPSLPRDRESSLLNRPGDKETSDLSNNKWLGVKGSLSFGLLDTVVMGQLYIILSTSHIKVARLSSSVGCSRSSACRIFRTVRMHLSQIPPKWEP